MGATMPEREDIAGGNRTQAGEKRVGAPPVFRYKDPFMEPWRWRFERFVQASPRVVIENFLDLDHVIHLHGDSILSHKVIESGNLASLVELKTVFAGIVMRHREWVQLIPPNRMVFRSRLLGGLVEVRVDSIVTAADGGTLLRTDYTLSPPWFIHLFKPLLMRKILLWKDHVWEEDRLLLERRQALLDKGFRDGAPIRGYFQLSRLVLEGDPRPETAA